MARLLYQTPYTHTHAQSKPRWRCKEEKVALMVICLVGAHCSAVDSQGGCVIKLLECTAGG
jgi:hypothetical protein